MTASELLDAVAGLPVLVVGDLMLDEYVFGHATRISPEAPVMVIRQERIHRLPGGAANVARNVVALGGIATLAGVIGCDEGGDLLEAELRSTGLGGLALIRDKDRSTTRKTRVVADHSHQVLRIDSEHDASIRSEIEEMLIESAVAQLPSRGALILSDYLKGTLTGRVATALIAEARKRNIVTVANPKPRSLAHYAGASLVSLNRQEASEALGARRPISADEAGDAAKSLRESTGAGAVLITLGEAGMIVAGPETISVPAPKVEVYDTAGAGDTVVAAVGLGLASGGFRRAVFELATQAAACVVRHVGVATPSSEDLDQIRSGTA